MKLKYIFLLFLLTILICSNYDGQERKSSILPWALSVENILNTLPDTNFSQGDLHNYYELDKVIIFNSIVNAVKNRKLKAYRWYPEAELSMEEFNDILVHWDSLIEGDPIKTVLTADDIVEIRFKESMELDTVSYRLIKKVSMAQFLKNKKDDNGQIIGKTILFNVKFNEQSNASKNNTIIWAENAESFIPMKRDSLWEEEEWYQKYIMDKETIYNSITQAALKGKIKVFSSYPEKELNQKEFYNTITRLDTVFIEDLNNPQLSYVLALLTYTINDITQIRFVERIEFDTVSCTLTKKVNILKFIKQERNEAGEVVGMKKLYEVKLNN